MTYSLLYMRSHNDLCDLLSARHPDWDDERIFQTARLTNNIYMFSQLNNYAMSYFSAAMRDIAPNPDGLSLIRIARDLPIWDFNEFFAYAPP